MSARRKSGSSDSSRVESSARRTETPSQSVPARTPPTRTGKQADEQVQARQRAEESANRKGLARHHKSPHRAKWRCKDRHRPAALSRIQRMRGRSSYKHSVTTRIPSDRLSSRIITDSTTRSTSTAQSVHSSARHHCSRSLRRRSRADSLASTRDSSERTEATLDWRGEGRSQNRCSPYPKRIGLTSRQDSSACREGQGGVSTMRRQYKIQKVSSRELWTRR